MDAGTKWASRECVSESDRESEVSCERTRQVTDTDNVPVGRFGHSAVVYQSSMCGPRLRMLCVGVCVCVCLCVCVCVCCTTLIPLQRFVFGGWDGHDTLDDLYEFSITTNQW